MFSLPAQRSNPRRARLAGLLLALCACARTSGQAPPNSPVTPATHGFFAISSGPHALDCNTCHGEFSTFKQFNCLGCHAHEQTPTDAVHGAVTGYRYSSAACYSCHQTADGGVQPFSHTGITADCASCHAVSGSFAALPVAGFTHPPMNGADCAACHVITSWTRVGGPEGTVSDPARDVTVETLIPAYSGTSIAQLSARTSVLPMPMNHGATGVPAGAFSSCLNCHLNANAGAYYPGRLHSSLANLKLAQPTGCAECHAASAPPGFVGPTATSPARVPPSGEMKHDAVAWLASQPTATPLVTGDCSVCHVSPSQAVAATWATSRTGTGPALFHSSLATQPGSCLDCHANSRPDRVLTSADATLPVNLAFDHGAAAARVDCVSCHAVAAWSGGRFHPAGAAAPATCLPCHAGERPTSTAGWINPSYQSIPFDYAGNGGSTTHGAGQDCVACHTGPGTGAFGASPNFAAGKFDHDPKGIAGTTCVACHATQRPSSPVTATGSSSSFDHSVNGTGDCVGCHQATVAAGSYVNYFNPATNALPGGDWQGGVGYPGATLIGSANQFVTATELKLSRSGANNLVTGTTSSVATLYNQMLHTSTAIPAEVNPGTSSNGDPTKCWHCHTHDANGTVTAFSEGVFHASLTKYSATVNGAVTPLAQPTAHCADCHAQMRPVGIVQTASSDLRPMDHDALFSAAVTLNGQVASGAAGVDCSACHQTPSSPWNAGTFHANIGAAQPQDCAVCHYPLMADAPKADLTSGTNFGMRHGSAQLTLQNCQVCHGGATVATVASTSWAGGAFHASVPAQPTLCIDCHAVSQPASSTQSTVGYSFAAGGTATNAGQWMNHAAGPLAGKDCAACHAADAKPSGAVWSRSASFHGQVAASTCQACHGLTNGGGAVPGQNNNLPATLTSSSMVSSAASDPASGVPSGTHDQISHADVNVSSRDCNACHTQAGVSTAAGVAGKEWAQASFHTSFTAATPLVMNGTTGRCSDCHLNVRPPGIVGGQDHSAFTSAPGSQDCVSCHAWPGTGTKTTPNWLGASSSPQTITVGGFQIPQPPAASPTTQQGVNNLPHPTVSSGTSCTTCHASASGGKNANGYDHGSTLSSTNCASCHEAGSDLVGTSWNGVTNEASGAGDTRPFTLSSVYAAFSGNSRTVPYPNHFYPVDCNQCHLQPAGISHVTTGPAYLQIGSGGNRSSGAWYFPHNEARMTNPSTCVMCHTNGIPR